MNVLKRCFARLFDYSILYSFLYLIGVKLDILRTHILIIALVLIVPFLWIFIEALFLKLFNTTPGKALLGLKFKEKFTLKKAFSRSIKTWAQVMGCGLPPFSLICPLVAISTCKKDDELTTDSKGLGRIVLTAALIGAFCSSSLIWDRLHPRPTSALTINSEKYEGWIALDGDKFTAYFPLKATTEDGTLALPEDYDDLPLTEHSAEKDDIRYSIAYTTMPKAWLKYSESMILKYSVKYMAREMDDTTIKSRAYAQHGPLKAVDYVLNSKGKQVTGRMLLIKDRLYKIEVIHTPTAEITEQTNLFVQSFMPKA